MRPHEQAWELDTDGDVRRVSAKGARTSLVCLRAATGDTDGMVLIAAAPAMARALLRVLGACANTGSRARGCIEDNIKYPCQACEAKAALRAAGVLP